MNNQDSTKFKKQDVTGTVECMCSHVEIASAVDLQHGERCVLVDTVVDHDLISARFANTDYALAHALRQRRPGKPFLFSLQRAEVVAPDDDEERVDHVLSYDIMCQYSVNIVHRFKQNPEWQDLVPVVENMRWAIPALHVVGHKDSCTYEFSTSYMDCVGHFHGETAEHYWPEANQLGPLVRQMNNGNRQDTLIDHNNDWNWKKTQKMGKRCMFDGVACS